jgi:hypothetical protein
LNGNTMSAVERASSNEVGVRNVSVRPDNDNEVAIRLRVHPRAAHRWQRTEHDTREPDDQLIRFVHALADAAVRRENRAAQQKNQTNED